MNKEDATFLFIIASFFSQLFFRYAHECVGEQWEIIRV